MTKNIKDYLHLYLGCDCEYFEKLIFGDIQKRKAKLKGVNYPFAEFHPITVHSEVALQTTFRRNVRDIKPILRPLSDMTEGEMEECGNMIYDFSNDEALAKWEWKYFETGLDAEQFNWLLSKHFDLFGLIEAGLAIDKTTLNKTTIQ
jgi:hypothetical protein